MPPKGGKIPDEQIKLMRDWIDGGAIANVNAKAKPRPKKKSFAMSAVTNERPNKIAMPIGLPTDSQLQVTRLPMISSVASSPWAPVVAVAAANQVFFHHPDAAKKDSLLGVLPWGHGQPKIVLFSRDGSRLLAAGGRPASLGYAVVWDVASGEPLLQVGEELDEILAADISPAGDFVATGGPERVVRLYRLDDSTGAKLIEPAFEQRDHTDWVTTVAFSPDGKWLATGDRNGGVFIRDAANGQQHVRLPSHKLAVTSIAWRADSQMFATGSRSGKVTLWNPRNGNSIKSFDTHKDGCSSLVFSRDGRLVTGGRDRMVKLWDGKGKRLQVFKGLQEIVTAVGVNDETQQIVAGDFAGQIKTWKVDQPKKSGQLRIPVAE
jgi:tricorn protease-like protein